MTIYSETFSMADLSAATGVNVQTLKTWLHNKLPVATGVSGGGGPGQRRRFTFFSVMEFAIAQALSEVTYGTRDMGACFRAARDFAHTSGGGKTFNLPFREPAMPFNADGCTIFAVAGERTFEELWVPGSSRDIYGNLRHFLHSDHFVVLNASEIFNQVCARLDMNPDTVMNEAYGVED